MGGKTHEICLILHGIADVIYMDMMHVSIYEKMNAFTKLGQSVKNWKSPIHDHSLIQLCNLYRMELPIPKQKY